MPRPHLRLVNADALCAADGSPLPDGSEVSDATATSAEVTAAAMVPLPRRPDRHELDAAFAEGMTFGMALALTAGGADAEDIGLYGHRFTTAVTWLDRKHPALDAALAAVVRRGRRRLGW